MQPRHVDRHVVSQMVQVAPHTSVLPQPSGHSPQVLPRPSQVAHATQAPLMHWLAPQHDPAMIGPGEVGATRVDAVQVGARDVAPGAVEPLESRRPGEIALTEIAALIRDTGARSPVTLGLGGGTCFPSAILASTFVSSGLLALSRGVQRQEQTGQQAPSAARRDAGWFRRLISGSNLRASMAYNSGKTSACTRSAERSTRCGDAVLSRYRA